MLSPLFFVSSDTIRIRSLLQLNLLPSEGSGVAGFVSFLTEGRPFHSAVLDFDDVPPLILVVSTFGRLPACGKPVTVNVVLFWLECKSYWTTETRRTDLPPLRPRLLAGLTLLL